MTDAYDKQSVSSTSVKSFIFGFSFLLFLTVISMRVHSYKCILLVQIAKEHGGIMRFIQVSCLGASLSSSSRYLKSKAAAEEAVLRELPEVSYTF